jgi:hypothetical protein
VVAASVFAGLSPAATGADAGGEAAAPPVDPSPAAVLAGVRENLPDDPLLISGRIIVRRRHGIVIAEFGFDMALRWGEAPASARYVLRDRFGRELESLTVTRPRGAEPSYTYTVGDPPLPAPTPELASPIRESDMSWLDLTLSFLWWEAVSYGGVEDLRGQTCHIVDVVAPPGSEGPYARARLWIDRQLLMLLQAEALDGDGRPVRRLWVESFKKINGRWMIKDMEVQAEPPLQRTKIRVTDVRAADGAVLTEDGPAGGVE